MTTLPADPKIIDLLQKGSEGPSHISLEYFPPRTEEGVQNLHKRMDRMLKTTKPLFTDVTWGAGGSTADLSLQLALRAHQTGHVANMHLTCTNMGGEEGPVKAVHDALEEAYKGGIRNIVALRGDPPAGEEVWTAAEGGFTCALDLVTYMRKEFGDKFGISVAGYPEGHPNSISKLEEGETMSPSEEKRASVFDGVTYVCKDKDYKTEMDYLKKKVDAGADFIITQMFFDVQVFKQFVLDCREWGITCPVIPGLMCINAYGGFCKMTKFCKTRVPKDLQEKMDSLKDDTDALKKFGVEFGTSVCKELVDFGSKVLHFYTLNLEKVVYGIMGELGLMDAGTANGNADADANTMVAKGSAWARVGDNVKCIYGTGVVKEIREGGMAVVEMDKWTLTGGQKPVCYLRHGNYSKVF